MPMTTAWMHGTYSFVGGDISAIMTLAAYLFMQGTQVSSCLHHGGRNYACEAD